MVGSCVGSPRAVVVVTCLIMWVVGLVVVAVVIVELVVVELLVLDVTVNDSQHVTKLSSGQLRFLNRLPRCPATTQLLLTYYYY